jgi:hypothetical protein
MVRMQWVVCPACGHGHTFSLPVGKPIARAYGYTCPETGGPAAIGLRGQWKLTEHPAPGAVVLSPLGVAAEAPTA